ncbi:hypothetical protein MGN70_007866 [Eutypa lata]|nr:hypothetical protein MGN70_007866 [Eutypa lata]
MAPIKRVGATDGCGFRGVKGSTSRVSKSAHNGGAKAKKLMRPLRWYDVEETSDLDDISDGENITDDMDYDMDVYGSVVSQSQSKQETIVKKHTSEGDNVNIHDIPQWRGPSLDRKIKKHKSEGDNVSLHDIPQWRGPSLDSKVKADKGEEHSQVKVEDIPQYPYHFGNASSPAGMPKASRGISPSFGGQEYGLSDYPELEGMDQDYPRIQLNSYNPYYSDLLQRKKELLLEMERVMLIQERIDAMNATARLAMTRLNAAHADVNDHGYLWWPQNF